MKICPLRQQMAASHSPPCRPWATAAKPTAQGQPTGRHLMPFSKPERSPHGSPISQNPG
jgi:hypothetical protein